MAPLRGQDMTGEAITASRSMLPCLSPGAVLGADTQGSVLGGGGAEGHIPTAEPPSSSAWRGREVMLLAFGSTKQDQAYHHRTKSCSSATAPRKSWITAEREQRVGRLCLSCQIDLPCSNSVLL